MRSDSEGKKRGPFPVLTILAGVVLAAALGCKAKTPPVGAFPPPAAAADRALVCDFESGDPTAINPDLFDLANPPSYRLLDPGEVSYWEGPTVSVTFGGPVAGGAAGTGFSYRCFGSLVDCGDDEYPSFTLHARFRDDESEYDMGAFSGIKFYLKVESDDTALKREFEIPLTSTMPVTNGGTCLHNCWDHFHVEYGNTGGIWVPVVLAFTDFEQQGYGETLAPPNLTGANLQKALGLQWSESNDNTPGTITFDFYIDEVTFY
jgi:hypothetical protein